MSVKFGVLELFLANHANTGDDNWQLTLENFNSARYQKSNIGSYL